MDIDLWMKALHVAAALTFAGGLLADSLAVAACSLARDSHKLPDVPAALQKVLQVVQRWDQRITAPALLIVWAAGLTMAIRGGWFASPWLMIKLAIVLFLSALHGVLSGTLRTLSRDPARHAPSTVLHAAVHYAAPAVVICVALISILVVTKPF
jgi:uncharacterized membrane protein